MVDRNDLFAGMPYTRHTRELSHYTTLDGFLNIIRESMIRASNILFLNDKEEMRYGIKVAALVLEQLEGPKGKTRESRRRKPILDDVPDVYACCFCEEPDMLSQWRGYGSASQSVSIQLDAHQLEQIADAQNLELVKVIYGEKEAKKLIRERLKEADAETLLERFVLDDVLGIHYRTIEERRRNIIFDLAPRFKDDTFDEEREWRIIARAHVVKKIEYRTRDHVIMPFVNIGSAGSGLPITRVTIGPGKDSALTKLSVEKFLSQNDLYRNVPVVESSIPFRT